MTIKKTNEMTDSELIKFHDTGKLWVINRMQVSNTSKNKLGEPYDHSAFLSGLRRIEEIEDTMLQRKLL